MPKTSANERRLAKLLREYAQSDAANGDFGYGPAAAFLSKRGVLAVSAATLAGFDAWDATIAELCDALRRLARGK